MRILIEKIAIRWNDARSGEMGHVYLHRSSCRGSDAALPPWNPFQRSIIAFLK
jgi:hypothetical protein